MRMTTSKPSDFDVKNDDDEKSDHHDHHRGGGGTVMLAVPSKKVYTYYALCVENARDDDDIFGLERGTLLVMSFLSQSFSLSLSLSLLCDNNNACADQRGDYNLL